MFVYLILKSTLLLQHDISSGIFWPRVNWEYIFAHRKYGHVRQATGIPSALPLKQTKMFAPQIYSQLVFCQ